MNCQGCGVELEPSEDLVNHAVDQILETSLQDATKTGGVCPLCGHCKAVPPSQKKSFLFVLFVACLLSLAVTMLLVESWRRTDRASVINAAVAGINGNVDVVRLMGSPIKAGLFQIEGQVKQDETGWKEAHFTFPVYGPHGQGQAQIIAGKGSGGWTFTTFEVDLKPQHKKLDLISGRIVEYDPNTYVDVHTQAAVLPEAADAVIPAARFDGTFPCVSATVAGATVSSQFGKCAMPVAHAGTVDRFEADLRNGTFVLRETDLRVNDVFDVPLTRSYRSREWAPPNPVQAFGRNSSHPYDIAPVGTRNPYTWLLLVLEDGDSLYFPRVSKGSGYSDALYMHTETSTRFYKATQQWNGNGWTLKLADGSEILFPESYNAKNLAQGAPNEIRDAHGNRLELIRDGQRNLQEIKTPHGHWIKFSYDELSRVREAANDAGEWAQYEYNSDGMLATVVLSSGRQRHYEYAGQFMTQVKDEAGRVLVSNWYHQNLLSQQQFADGTIYSYSYDWPSKSKSPEHVSITFPDRTTKELSVADSVPEFVRNYPGH